MEESASIQPWRNPAESDGHAVRFKVRLVLPVEVVLLRLGLPVQVPLEVSLEVVLFVFVSIQRPLQIPER
ncbi:hypothetical protein QJS10_CPA10g01615 [Acorus calamus]|uniref:Uncharacterized protein n=1 Tax=Acorus calamus TaxID=4465 RepID=A0AAV9DXA1_ACOCL|nr:hypothetical protein QJS10_CPA10g01615 [Acorus calamus]